MNVPQKQRTIVQLVLVDETGDSYYRMRWPARELAAQRPDWRVINLDARAEERFAYAEHADLLVVYQSQDYDLIPIIRRRREAGRATLVEYNDNFYAPPPSSPVAEPWSSPLIWQAYEALMKEGDVTIVTGEGLRELFATAGTSRIQILENHLNEPPAAFESLWKEPDDEIWMGWGGSLGHIPDFLAILPAIQQLFSEIPQLRFKVMGNDSLPAYVGLPVERFRYVPWGSIHDYYRFWNGVHIGIAPLLDTPYNRCRSDVKAVEMSAHGVLPVLARLLPYEKFIEQTGAPSYRTIEEFKILIHQYCRDFSALRQAAQRCHSFVATTRIGPQRCERSFLYEEFMTQPSPAYDWPLGAGYHEVLGNQSGHGPSHQLLMEVQQLLTSKQLDQASSKIDLAHSIYSAHPGVCFARAKVMRLKNDSNFVPFVESCVGQFPRDIRFRILMAESVGDTDVRIRLWSELIQDVRKLPGAAQRSFESLVLPAFIRALKNVPSLAPCGELLTQVYPERLALRVAMARTCVRSQDTISALAHFQRAVRIAEAVESNSEAMRSESLPELRSWVEALEGRARG